MKPVFALVGRPNVGKSTLFNRLTKSRDALVADYPGLTRDRKYGSGVVGERDYLLIDTGGLTGEDVGIDEYMAAQTWMAVDEADVIMFLVDGREGLTAADDMVARRLRREGKHVYLLVNKIDTVDPDQACAEFYQLGFADVFPIAAAQNRGITKMMTALLDNYPDDGETEEEIDTYLDTIRIAFIGRPNVGKSTLINRMMGEERVVAFNEPGTTRDSIFVPFERDGEKYTLIDTAGVRRRSKVNEAIEKFSIIKTLDAIEKSHVVIMLLDAHETITEQDAHLLGLVLDAGRSLVLAINKWDGLDEYAREQIRTKLEVKLPFLEFADRHFISALHGTGVGHLFQSVHEAYDSSMLKISTARMTKMLETAVQAHQLPISSGRRIKLRYAHQGGSNPFTIIIHGNQTKRIANSYKRYLMNYFRQTLKLKGTQVRIEFKTGDNPFDTPKKRARISKSQEYRQKRNSPHKTSLKNSKKK
ncbi:MAG TPA: ribosome biogenesis GTPase Der [Leucothrix mucor]|uniref:GTPase Der n=1 Tax=Leucothrix mucor TaxID=45248 RepID=A0A7V2T128_LEUMU|nr:ribosome biogenesis GTPase Der [Leucothrix mucor]